MIRLWEDLQTEYGPIYADIIQDGIDKLESYASRIERVPAYTISMGV